MRSFRPLSTIEQLVAHLRGEIVNGHLSGAMPGVNRLVAELGVGTKTVLAAVEELERQGFLKDQGPRRPHRIVLPEGERKKQTLRIAILHHEPLEMALGYMTELQYLLQQAGHDAFFTGKCLIEMKMDVARVARLVRQTEADAWVIQSASKEVLEWFVTAGIPAFALFGRRQDLPIPGVGPDKVETFRVIVRRMAALGHRRMVLLTLKMRRLPVPGTSEQVFLDELAAQGIPPSPYNLPDWEESPEGIHTILDTLFRVTPPTMLLLDEAYLFHAVKHYLSQRGIRVPEDVSLICTDPDRTFAWCRPSFSHIMWESNRVIRQVVRWAANVSQGKADLRQMVTPAKFVEGGTIGRAKK